MSPLVPMDDVLALEGASCYRLSRPDVDSKIGPDLWYPTGLAEWRNGAAQAAVQVCRNCPVRMACIQIALRRGETDGIWGGFDMGDPEQRRRGWNLGRKAS